MSRGPFRPQNPDPEMPPDDPVVRLVDQFREDEAVPGGGGREDVGRPPFSAPAGFATAFQGAVAASFSSCPAAPRVHPEPPRFPHAARLFFLRPHPHVTIRLLFFRLLLLIPLHVVIMFVLPLLLLLLLPLLLPLLLLPPPASPLLLLLPRFSSCFSSRFSCCFSSRFSSCFSCCFSSCFSCCFSSCFSCCFSSSFSCL
ncbi:hypothetical protein D5F01_LYC15572 [Larimichthys crocea]|uniref:Uncharacterized protein n=1 Tax=Larimichthys crocea TaxID=215358 RepID=A0A6G0I3L4_LARCR|nr:hypothetical protein D5F01_LYC15572 [Larimichthys crocea]